MTQESCYLVNEDTEVWIGSLWHRDCDPFVTVIGLQHDDVQRALRREKQEEIERILYEDCDETCDQDCEEHMPDIMSGAIFLERLGDITLRVDDIMLRYFGITYQ